MKRIIYLVISMLAPVAMFAQVPTPPPPPVVPVEGTIKVEDEKVTITTVKGDIFIIDEFGVRKNGIMIAGDSEALREEIEDLQDEIDDIREESASLAPGSDAYNDLMDEVSDLEDELTALSPESMYPDTLPGDSTALTIGNWRLIVKETGDDDDVDVTFGKVPAIEEINDHYVDPFQTEWFLFDMGYNTYLNADYKTQLEDKYKQMEDLHGWGSFDVNLHVWRSRVNMAKGFIDFNYGMSLEWHHFRYDQNFSILPNMDSLTLATETLDYDKNKFNTTHLTIPLLLGFETKPWDPENSFRMQFGYSPGLMLRGKTKHKLDGKKDIEFDVFNLAQFRHELNYVIGYGDFNVYASYDLNSMFAEGEGPELHPFSVGLIIRRGFE